MSTISLTHMIVFPQRNEFDLYSWAIKKCPHLAQYIANWRGYLVLDKDGFVNVDCDTFYAENPVFPLCALKMMEQKGYKLSKRTLETIASRDQDEKVKAYASANLE